MQKCGKWGVIMFSNQRKTIGVFQERAVDEFQNQLCQGIISEAKKTGYNVALFSSYGKYGNNDAHLIGDQKLFDFPLYEKLDGAILALDTMTSLPDREALQEKILTRCHCPIVSVREILEGTNNLLVKNTTCMDGIIDHFIKDHGFTKLCFMSGPKSHWDAVERMQNFYNKMAEYDLPVEEHQVLWGDYWKNMGKEACDWFLSGSEFPQAIICANDHMALAVASELIGRGIQIPEDICISGYDGLRGTLTFSPSITTMVVPFREMGVKAVQLIDEKQDCPDDVENYFFQAQVIARESCGCQKRRGKESLMARRNLYENQNIEGNKNLQFDYFSVHLSSCSTMAQMADYIHSFSHNIEGLKDYAICLFDNIEETNGDDGKFNRNMELRLAIQNDTNMGALRLPFSQKLLIPENLTDDSPQCWYFSSLHFQDTCYGYEAFQFHDPETTGKLYFRWNVTLGNKIHDLVVEHEMQRLIVKLKSMYDRDSLTGMYNRRGLDDYGVQLFQKAARDKNPLFLAVIDLDGMKQINDNYGHIEGDFALQKISEFIQQSCTGENISARTGGDEFVVIALELPKEEPLSWLAALDQCLEKFNASGKKPYPIHASHGYSYRVPRPKEAIESFIKESDEDMYKNKIINKARRGDPLR